MGTANPTELFIFYLRRDLVMRELIMRQNKNKKSLITVYMPTYNRVDLLQRAVESVLSQDYKNIELIVVDDGSTDDTHEYLAKMAKKDSRLKYFINEKNSGACVSRNRAIFAADGEFITGLDDDDYFLSDHISSLVDSWNEIGSEYTILYVDTYIKKKSGIKKVTKKIHSCKKKDLICANWIGNQIFTKVIYLKKINGFDGNLSAWQDIECWYRLLSLNDLKAFSTRKYTYVIDISHPHERISAGKALLVYKAYEYFCKKHNLTANEKKIMKLQYNSYIRKPPNIKSILIRLYYLPKLYNIKSSVFTLFKF